jgi:hypothetical protein
MKNYIGRFVVLCGLSLISGHTFAQKGFEIGIRYMLQNSYLFNKNDKNAGGELERDNTWSYLSGGLALGYNFNAHTGLELDLLRSRQGQKYSGMNPLTGSADAYNHQVALQQMLNSEPTAGSYKARAELNFLQIPLLLKLATNNPKPINFNMVVGPQLNILNSAVYELNEEDVELPGTNIEPNDAYKKTTIDGIIGVGLGYKISTNWQLSGQVRFDYGFQDVENKDLIYTYNNSSQNYYGSGRSSTNNGAIQLMFGISYKL